MADQTRKRKRGKQPFSRHPLFPAVLALWCGAVLALAGLVAAPAMALTTRILLALGLGALGALLGIALARRINTVQLGGADPASADTQMAEGDSALWRDLKASRRALAEEAKPSHPAVRDSQPVIEREPQILDVAECGIEGWTEPAEDRAEALPVAPVQASVPVGVERIAQADLNDLSPVELLERLALSMERRRTMHVPETAPSLMAVEPALDADGPPLPAKSLQPALDPADEAGEGHCPGEVPASGLSHRPEDAEEALRAALAALQKMSGAA